MIRRTVLAALLLAAVGLGTGCGVVQLPCDMVIAALPAESTLAPGDPLPGFLLMLAGPGEIDQTASAIVPDATGGTAIDLVLRGDAVADFGTHTADHVGESMAIAINGTIVAVPVIQGPIPDGRVQVTAGALGGAGGSDLAERFSGCVR